METERLGFAHWTEDDLALAMMLWGNATVTRLIGARDGFDEAAVAARLQTEVENQRQHQVQYWPIFSLATGQLAGCCGLRPYAGDDSGMELGIHLLPDSWGQGLAVEACTAVIQYARQALPLRTLYAGHHPENSASRRLLLRLGFVHQFDALYPPTGLMHPTYSLEL